MVEKFPLLNNKPALMRAYKRTISREGGGDGDDWVVRAKAKGGATAWHTDAIWSLTGVSMVQERDEFANLLVNLFYFNKLWKAFDAIDHDDDRRLDFAEFQKGLKHIGLKLPAAEAKAEFAAMDKNGGGVVLFDGGCARIGPGRGRRLTLGVISVGRVLRVGCAQNDHEIVIARLPFRVLLCNHKRVSVVRS